MTPHDRGIRLGRKTSERLALIFIIAIVENNDRTAYRLLHDCFPGRTWDEDIYIARAEAWQAGLARPKALLPQFSSAPSV